MGGVGQIRIPIVGPMLGVVSVFPDVVTGVFVSLTLLWDSELPRLQIWMPFGRGTVDTCLPYLFTYLCYLWIIGWSVIISNIWFPCG